MNEACLAGWAFWMMALAIFAFGGDRVFGVVAIGISCLGFLLDYVSER
jgi:hypothetical protein